ncbi:IS630 family transposase [Oleomonas cavernae]|uniref:IS630 family transposase n=1 Tax=Oleomonas cavernae TaxID=2320859 RepID=A0A418WGJ2_9PROT|nr:IS630 family transposase [Oleomonas cavernae]RJF89145.1 IS630 family transposase [Oleomonas cavernae]
MGKPYSTDLRERIEAHVASGHSRRDAARHFGVSPSCAVKLVQWVAATGSVAPARQGRPPGGGKLAPHMSLLIGWVEAEPDITMPALAARLKTVAGVTVHPASLSRALLWRRASASKKSLLASECGRDEIHEERRTWRVYRQPRLREQPQRLVFIDETATTTKMTRLRGRARRGIRLKARAPFGHWKTQTFIAALRSDGLTAPWLIDGAMNRTAFETYVETQLAPTLTPGDVVILDNLACHKSENAKASLKARGAWFLFLPRYSPDLNPIEMAFAKLKAHLRRIGARTIDALWRAVGDICDLYAPGECLNYLKAAGYASD